MGQISTSKVFKTISYKYIGKGDSLVVILPRAGAKFISHEKLIHSLSKSRGVVFIEKGCFGISIVDDNLESLKMDVFRKNLHALIKRLGYKKVILIGESVGAIHALNYAVYHKENVKLLVLSNPALYKPRLIYEGFFMLLLKLGAKTSPDRLLKIFGKVLIKFSQNDLKKLGKTFSDMNHTIGALSYLECLREIADFSKVYKTEIEKSILDKTIVFRGLNDKVFSLLCDQDYCRNASRYIEISAGHGLIDANPKDVVSVVS